MGELPRLLTPSQAAAYFGLSKPSFHRFAEKTPGFPKPIYLGERLPRWDRRALDSFLDAQTASVSGYVDPDVALGG